MTMESAIDLIAQSMIARYGQDASFTAAQRARVLETCNDRQVSRTWFLISGRIDEIAPPVPKSEFRPSPEQYDWMLDPSADVERETSLHDEPADKADLVTVD